MLRRLVAADGRSRAFVNDEPASVGLLRELGDSARRDPGPGRAARPARPGDASRAARRLRRAHGRPRRARRGLARLARQRASAPPRRRACLAESRAEEDLLRHHYAEIDALAPEGDEEDRLAARRALLQNAERLGEAIGEAIGEIDGEAGAQRALARALRRLERARDRAQGLLDSAVAAAERAAQETDEALAALTAAGRALELDPRALEEVEERLFALRALARKHQVAVADLPVLRVAMADRLAAIETGAEGVAVLEEASRGGARPLYRRRRDRCRAARERRRQPPRCRVSPPN